MVVDLCLALKVFPVKTITSGQIEIPCRPLNIAISWGEMNVCFLFLVTTDD